MTLRPVMTLALVAMVLPGVPAIAQSSGVGHADQAGHAAARSPYAGLESRQIKALSAERIAGLEAGEGLGFAMAAELNGYPGPKHVLELSDELGLKPEQVAATEKAFERMRASAVELGTQIVERERELDRLFREERITAAELARASAEIGALTGELRAVHLRAHLEMVVILTRHQRHAYQSLRGYDSAEMHDGHHPGMH